MQRSDRSTTACPTACRSSRGRSSLRRWDRDSCSGSRGKRSGCQANEVPDSRLRPLADVLDVPPIAAPLRRLCEWTADYYLAPLASVLRMVLPSSAALDGPRQLTEYRLTGLVPDRLTPQREKALSALEARQGTIRELAHHADVSDGVLRGLVNAGALEAVAVDADRSARLPRSRSRAARSQRRPAERSRKPRLGRRQGLRPGAARRRHRLGQDRSLFRGHRGVPAARAASARPAAGNRAHRTLPEAVRGAVRLRSGRLALGPSLLAAAASMARHRRRRSGGDRRSPLGALPALSEARADRCRRGPRAELQTGRWRSVSRPRLCGDARQVRGHSRDPVDGDSADREQAHGGAWPVSRSLASPSLRGRDAARHPADRPHPGSAAARALACPQAGRAKSKRTSAVPNNRCCSSTAAASPR